MNRSTPQYAGAHKVNTSNNQGTTPDSQQESELIARLGEARTRILNEMHKVIVGQEEFIELLLVSLLADGHVLIEGVPGVAKTITAKLLSRTMSINFSRIQFTPDLMPSDILGTSVYNSK